MITAREYTRLGAMVAEGQFHPELACLVTWENEQVKRLGDYGKHEWAEQAADGLGIERWGIVYDGRIYTGASKPVNRS